MIIKICSETYFDNPLTETEATTLFSDDDNGADQECKCIKTTLLSQLCKNDLHMQPDETSHTNSLSKL